MFFQKFPSIENTYRQKTIDIITDMGKAEDKWIATVKVHGANFSMHTDGSGLLAASKNGFIDGKFYGYERLLAKYAEGVFELFQALGDLHPASVRQMAVYGEIFGGMYNHDDIPKNTKSVKVMKGVSYTPDNDFYMFGLTIDGVWQNFDKVTAGSLYLGCPLAYIVGQGTLKECLALPNDGLDPIHKLYGLPEVDDNIMEGLVIQPYEPFFLPNGKMAILKNKGDRFKEKASKAKRERIPVVYSKIVTDQMEEISKYVTDNRLSNILSHHGEIGSKDFGKITGMLSRDVLEDYLVDNEEMYNILGNQEKGVVRKHGQILCASLFKPKFLEMKE